MKAKWLYSKHPIVIDTDLAVVLGSNGDREAIVLQQLNYWLHSNIAKKIDGRMWIYNTFENWQKDNFPWLSVRTVRRIFTNLEEKGLILTGNFNKAGFDKTKWYSIDEDALNDLMSNACGQNGRSIVTKCPDGGGQNDPTYTRDYTETTTDKDIYSSALTETVAPTADTRTNTDTISDSPSLDSRFEKLWREYPKKQGKKDALRHYKAWIKASSEHTDDYLLNKLNQYKAYLKANRTDFKFIQKGSTWFNGSFDDDWSIKSVANNYNSAPAIPQDSFTNGSIEGVNEEDLPF